MSEEIEYGPIDMLDYSCPECGDEEPGWIDTGGVTEGCTIYECANCGYIKSGCD